MFLVCLLQLDDCVLCRVYRKDDSRDRDCKRSRDKSVIDESSSSSKTPRLELNPNKANNQITVGGGMESVQERINHQYNPYINSHQALQNQPHRSSPSFKFLNLQMLCFPSFPRTTFKFFIRLELMFLSMARTTTWCNPWTSHIPIIHGTESFAAAILAMPCSFHLWIWTQAIYQDVIWAIWA